MRRVGAVRSPHYKIAPMKPKELTLRGLILGALITTVFTAANVYLGLKVGLTFASSIPAQQCRWRRAPAFRHF